MNLKNLTQTINGIMGASVLSEEQLKQIMRGSKSAYERQGMAGIIEYLMKVTQADVEKEQLQEFAEKIKSNPKMGKDILQKRRKLF